MNNSGWIDECTFSCFVPAQMVVVKGGTQAGGDKQGKLWIQGIASTSERDLQGEVVVPSGIDFSYFLKHGYFNDDHKAGPENKIGEPTEAKLTKDGLWVKGFLYPNKENARGYWDLMQAQAATGSNRRVGFSIQGKVVRRNGKTIERCWIQEIAVTTQPINTSTWTEVAKSLASQPWCANEDLDKCDDDRNGNKDKSEKALSAESPVVKESLESDVKDVVTKSYTFSEAVAYLQAATGYSRELVEAVVEVAFASGD